MHYNPPTDAPPPPPQFMLDINPQPPQVVLELAKIIREDYLQQNAFSEHDFNCPLTKSVGMLRVIVQLYRRALKAVTGSDATGAAASTNSGAKTITWNVIKATQTKLINRVTVGRGIGCPVRSALILFLVTPFSYLHSLRSHFVPRHPFFLSSFPSIHININNAGHEVSRPSHGRLRHG